MEGQKTTDDYKLQHVVTSLDKQCMENTKELVLGLEIKYRMDKRINGILLIGQRQAIRLDVNLT